MNRLKNIKDREYIPQKTYIKLMLAGTYTLSKTLLFNLSDVKKLRQIDTNSEHFVRPPRAYKLPKYLPEMQYCNSSEKYLRKTLYCDHTEPEVVTLAYKLGAFEKTNYEFAEAAFHFVKEKMPLEILPFDSVGTTFRRGSGTCFHLITAFIALCRCAGIKARYKMFAMNMIKAWYDSVVDVDPLVKKWYDSMGYFMIEGEGEAFIDGKWRVAHVGPKAERQAAAGIPITRFGEDSLGRWFFAIPGTIMISESIPYGLGGSSLLLKKIAPGSMERVNISIQNQIKKGAQIIKQAGGLKEYDIKARGEKGLKMPKIDLSSKDEIVFAE